MQHTSPDPDKLSILSSESLAGFMVHDWNALKFACSECSIKIEKVIYYVRDACGFIMSAYDQVLKRHGSCGEFNDLVSCCCWDHYNPSFNLNQAFDSRVLVPLHFDSCKQNLLRTFFSQICKVGSNLDQEIAKVEKNRVNRSLTSIERDYLKKINAKLGAVYSQKLSDRFLFDNPEAQNSPLPIDDAIREVMRQRFQGQIDWVNAHFFEGKSIVSLFSETNPSYSAPSQNNANQDEITRKIVVEFLMEEFLDISSVMSDFILSKLAAIIKSPGPIPSDFPEGFSLLGYAILNPDLILADVDLAQHYRDYGRKEGRSYKVIRNLDN